MYVCMYVCMYDFTHFEHSCQHFFAKNTHKSKKINYRFYKMIFYITAYDLSIHIGNLYHFFVLWKLISFFAKKRQTRSAISKISRSVFSQPRQGSVIDRPYSVPCASCAPSLR